MALFTPGRWLARAAAMAVTLGGIVSCGGLHLGEVLERPRAEEQRVLNATHVEASPIEVVTRNGHVEIVADPAVSDVQIVAEIRAVGDTDEEAASRLAAVVVDATRTAEGVLRIEPIFPGDPPRDNDGCSFQIRVPAATGATVRTTNGAVTLRGLHGTADVQTSNGAVIVADQGGDVIIESSNGTIEVADAQGAVTVDTSNGRIEVVGALGAVSADTSNGAIRIHAAEGATGPFRADTSNGAIRLEVPRTFKGALVADTSNGAISLEGEARAVEGDDDRRRILLGDGGGGESRLDTSNGIIHIVVRP